jgi:hypothetical protein
MSADERDGRRGVKARVPDGERPPASVTTCSLGESPPRSADGDKRLIGTCDEADQGAGDIEDLYETPTSHLHLVVETPAAGQLKVAEAAESRRCL